MSTSLPLDFFRLIIQTLASMKEFNTYCMLGQVCRTSWKAQTPIWTWLFKGLLALQRELYSSDIDAARLLPNLAIGLQIKLISPLSTVLNVHHRVLQLHPKYIKHVEQDEALQLIAVEHWKGSWSRKGCEFVESLVDPSDLVKLAIVKKWPKLLKLFEEQTPEMHMTVLCHELTYKHSMHNSMYTVFEVLKHFQGQRTIEVQVESIKHACPDISPENETYSEYIIRVLTAHPEAIQLLQNPHTSFQRIAYEAGVSISLVDNPCLNYQLVAAKRGIDRKSVTKITDPVAQAELFKKNLNLIGQFGQLLHDYALASAVSFHGGKKVLCESNWYTSNFQGYRTPKLEIPIEKIKKYESLRVTHQLDRILRTMRSQMKNE